MEKTSFTNKLEAISEKYSALSARLSQPEILADQEQYQKIVKAHFELAAIVETYHEYQKIEAGLADAHSLLKDESKDKELIQLAKEEIETLENEKKEYEEKLTLLLLPKDPLDEKNTIIEIRAGTGGDEAALFAAELFRMYSKYSELRNWKIEIIDSHTTDIGGLKEIIFAIEGRGAYSRFKFEKGTHRVQRVPVTESGGRIHTSAVTVAVLPEAEDVEIKIDTKDLRIDVFRSTGPGGQSVNTTDSAVRITHLPSGLVVQCQDEKSQHKNKAKAMRVLRARLLEFEEQKKASERARDRKSQVGTGERSERIRTYNFPQNRVTDHRINLTLYQLEIILEGNLDPLINALTTSDQAEKLKAEVT